MRIRIRGQDMEVDRSLREHIQRRLRFALARFSTRVREVTARLADVNGHRGGIDRRCRLMVHLIPTGTILVEDVDADPSVVIDRAADRAGRAVARELRRRWDVRRRAPRRVDDGRRQRSETQTLSHSR